ncbi:restriction endonuclease [Acidihalobacter aeolianus]|uniref:Restriction endonuclease n=1 Tax=Acidihalobacter aeolianus TaxID=2792603 RepID=A0A1D8K4K6_9GAMM|nr:restriction endonuclease [Acidihalobacter aeolianus]AOV15899.1 restriction endonuclease [Acidihalobacter aeolianus]
MPIPDYQTVMLPLLRLASDGREHKFSDSIDVLAAEFRLSDEERNELLPSGTQAVFDNRVGWARSYLKQAALLDSPRRGYFAISQRGRDLLKKDPDRIDIGLLAQYPEFIEFRNRKNIKKNRGPEQFNAAQEMASETPEDTMAAAYSELRESLEVEVLETIMGVSPPFFERIVVDLLVKMGYGGSRVDAGRALGKSGDGGIDGIINEDQLGLDVIYIQAKRWEGNVGRPEIQKFAGALQGQRAKKGVFITTSGFTREAMEYASLIDSRIILIDGVRLGKLLVDHGVGVSTAGVYEVKKLDSDYFE